MKSTTTNNKKIVLMMLESRKAMLEAKGPQNNSIVKKLARKIRQLSGEDTKQEV